METKCTCMGEDSMICKCYADKLHKENAELRKKVEELEEKTSRCFDVGVWGGCGVLCPVFVEGECKEPDFTQEQIELEHDQDDSQIIYSLYENFRHLRQAKKEE